MELSDGKDVKEYVLSFFHRGPEEGEIDDDGDSDDE